MESYTILKDKYDGETAFVVGAGTSLFSIVNSENFSKIFDNVAISINSSIMSMPWQKGKPGNPDNRYWISNDALVRRWTYWQNVKSANAIKIVRTSWEKYYDEIPGFLVFNPRPTAENIINDDDVGLAYCSSVPSGIDLAIQMGCGNIVLLGVDHYMDGFRSHYWQYWPRQKWPVGPLAMQTVQKRAFETNMLAFEALKKFAGRKNVKIYNCSEKSKVGAFKKVPFEVIINEKHLG